MIPQEKIIEKLELARGQRERLRDQLNACMGFIQACELLLAEIDKPTESQ